MNILGIILKGVASTILGPGASLIWTLTELIAGAKSGISAVASLLLSGVIDFGFESLDLGYEIDRSPDDFQCELALAAASGIYDTSVESLISDFRFSRAESGLITPSAIEINFNSGTPEIEQVWKKRDSSGLYLPPNYDSPTLNVTLQKIDSRKLHSKQIGRKLESQRLGHRRL